jgi:hypothetical protein
MVDFVTDRALEPVSSTSEGLFERPVRSGMIIKDKLSFW